MTKEQKAEVLTAILASAFTHQKNIYLLSGGPPTPTEAKSNYLHDPIINRLVDTTLLSIYQAFEMQED